MDGMHGSKKIERQNIPHHDRGRLIRKFTAIAIFVGAASNVLAWHENTERKAIEIVAGLSYPSGIAIQPETGEVFVADSGRGQVVRIVDGVAVPIITDFPVYPLGDASAIELGPLGLLFTDTKTLVVGSSAESASAPILQVFSISESAEAVTANSAHSSLVLSKGDQGSVGSVRRLYAMAATPETIYSCILADSSGAIVGRTSRSDLLSAPSNMDKFVDVEETLSLARPSGVTISPHGYLVVAGMGELSESNDSVLVFLDTVSRKPLLRLETGLRDISAVAYSRRRQMYALDLAWAKPEEGGLYQIIADETSESGMRTKKILSLTHPTAMAFDSEGTLYVTIAGEDDDAGVRQGKLLKIPAEEGL